MKLRLSTLLFSIALCAEAQAAPTAETEAVFEHAMLLADDIQQRIEQATVEEHEGKIDKHAIAQLFQELNKDAQILDDELSKASAGGHGVATFQLANMRLLEYRQEIPRSILGKFYAPKLAEACGLYQKATDQGLLAAAVVLFRDCTEALNRFGGPELLRQRSQLLKALEQPDPYSDHYPLTTMWSYCFKDSQVPEVNRQQPLNSLVDLYTPVFLSLKNFQADGYYLLAFKGEAQDPKVQAYFKQVQTLAPDCLDPMDLKSLFKHMERKNQ